MDLSRHVLDFSSFCRTEAPVCAELGGLVLNHCISAE